MAYTEDDFRPAFVPGQRYDCGCGGPLAPVKIKYVEDDGTQHAVCYRQQCQSCGFLRKNRIGRVLYFSYKDGTREGQFNYLPEYFWAPEEVTFDENMQYSRDKKIDFMRRILTLANRDKEHKGHLEYKKEQIYNLDLTKR